MHPSASIDQRTKYSRALDVVRYPLVLMPAFIPMLMALKGSDDPTVFTMAYRLAGFSMIPLSVELTGLALRIWNAVVSPIAVNRIYDQIDSVHIGPFVFDIRTIDAGALRYRFTLLLQLRTAKQPIGMMLETIVFSISSFWSRSLLRPRRMCRMF